MDDIFEIKKINMGRSTVQWNLTKTICSVFELDFPNTRCSETNCV